MTKIEPPEFLKQDGRLFWDRARAEREFVDAHDERRLEIACKLLDDIQADETVLREEGRFTRDRWNRRIPHPALKSLAENRIIFLRTIRELGLDLLTPEDPRQPRLY